jgi:anti-sigma regulatory factor (Ser/Thr protein kinase)
MAGQVVCVVADSSGVGTARRSALRLSEVAGLNDTDSGRVALVATELANNLVRHAGGGQLLLQVIRDESRGAVIELLSIDAGPGMRDVAQCLRDGYSSGGTAGTGLGAVKRVSEDFEVFTQPEKGCVVFSRVRSSGTEGKPSGKPSRWRWGVISTPAPGETIIGDSWRIVADGDDISIMVADGLGHGPLASEAAEAASEIFEEEPFGVFGKFFDRAHQVLRSTRGAAVAVAVLPGSDGVLRYAGVGNIAGTIITQAGTSRGLMSHNGTVGAAMRTVNELAYDWGIGDRLIMHSDGLTSRWSLNAYPALLSHHPAVLSAILFRDFSRGRDDATVVVMERVA